MDLVFTPAVVTEDWQVRLTTFDFAGPWRRVTAAGVNFVSVAVLFGALELSGSPSVFVVLPAILAVGLFHLGFIVVKRNSFGGELLGCVPVGYTGERLPRMVFFGRDWLFQFSLSALSFGGQIVFLPIAALLQAAFGEIPVLTTDFRSGDGLRVESLVEWIPGIALSIWALRDMARGPYHQAFHDRYTRTVVVRTSSARAGR